jgi:uncharacterized protein (TIGR02444 family)
MTNAVPTSSPPPSPFWTFSLGFYRQAGVPEACLQLQDGCGADVNIVLFLLWTASQGRRLSDEAVKALSDKVRSWQTDVIAPIRSLRRSLKDAPRLLDKGTAEVFRTKIKAIELEAERLQQEAMAALVPELASEPATSVEQAARGQIAVYQAVLRRRFDAAAIDALLTALRLFSLSPLAGRGSG